MNNNYLKVNERGVTYFNAPIDIFLNLDKYPMGQGINNFIITINEEEFKISKEEIHQLLKLIKLELRK